MSEKIRIATLADLSSIDYIYNQAIRQKKQTADTEPMSTEKRNAWFYNHPPQSYPIYVLTEGSNVIGWSSISKYREGRASLNSTAEVSYFLTTSHQGKGHGTALLEFTIQAARKLGYQNLVAILLSPNERSIGLLQKFQFEEWGRVPKAAKIDGQYHDHLYLGRCIT